MCMNQVAGVSQVVFGEDFGLIIVQELQRQGIMVLDSDLSPTTIAAYSPHACVSFPRCSVFIPQMKNMQIMSTGCYKL